MKYGILLTAIMSLCFIFCDPEELFRSAPIIREININPDRVNPFDTVYAEVLASNPEEGVLSYLWSVSPNRGLFVDLIDGTTIRWIAPTTGGDYTFKVEVSNSFKSAERTESVKVLEAGVPLVKIKAPQDNEYFIQGLEMEIEADAFHNNGINKVQLYVNDQLITEMSGSPSNSYNFAFTPDTTYLGTTEIKIEAVANFTLTIGIDSVMVNIEAILPGN
jgi:hypothetical protein